MQNRAAGRRLDDLTLMLGVNDEGRQGATRFWRNGTALADGDGVPAEADLSDIIRVADQIERDDPDIDEVALRRLFRATGSLGGARPKANVRLGEELWLAKFPKPLGDDWNVMAWEASMLDAMDRWGIDVPVRRTKQVTVDGSVRTILFLRRFDRGAGGVRIPYISAMTALEAQDGDGGDWLDLTDFARAHGADVTQLWRRAVFGVLVGNLDDHLRNHGFLRRGGGWALSPAFDVNPEPRDHGDDHELALFGAATLDVNDFLTKEALSTFGLSAAEARTHLDALLPLLEAMPRFAEHHGADGRSIRVMQTRLEAAATRLG
ncbi:type II toxin-antitoxin system HipA family toxin [Microbacterium sp. T32]|uniref:type II toxin-antitoxin system HipA family toxin n=1 Tax=Microbacterium sp. T32 TaxID=1776083 RepID=UPI0007AB5513|nr:HipA domain-containing protein [Microbacterium sp. T32]KZE33086.1 hypothetical protein AVW09_06805 [Microbacterium sp. T32]